MPYPLPSTRPDGLHGLRGMLPTAVETSLRGIGKGRVSNSIVRLLIHLRVRVHVLGPRGLAVVVCGFGCGCLYACTRTHACAHHVCDRGIRQQQLHCVRFAKPCRRSAYISAGPNQRRFFTGAPLRDVDSWGVHE